MPKRVVLGNDPFEHGAAARPAAPKAEPAATVDPTPPPPKAPRPAQARAPRPRRPQEAPASLKPPASAPEPRQPSAEETAPTLQGWAANANQEVGRALAVLRSAAEAVRAGLGSPANVELDVYGGDTKLQAAVAPLADFLYTRWFRVSVEGAEHVPRGGALLVANHAGALPIDGPVLHEVLRRSRPDLPPSRWLVEDQVFYAPLLGTLLNRLGAVRASPENATRLLSEGRPVCVFPEGIQGIGKPFRERYRLKRFGRGGSSKLALRTGAPILPVAIVGGEESLPLLAKLAGHLPRDALLAGDAARSHPPASEVVGPHRRDLSRLPAHLAAAGPPAGTEALGMVEDLVEQTRRHIEEMLQELLRARGAVFSG